MLSCQVVIPESSKLTFAETPAQNALTVGSEFSLMCTGEWPEGYFPEGAELPAFVLNPEDQGALRLLDFKFRDQNTAEIIVTSYKPGAHQFKNLGLRSGEKYQDLGAIEWTVASVINPQEPPAGPYGPVGPFRMTIPLFYWLLLFTIIFILFFTLGTKLYRKSQRKKLLSDPRLQESALRPAQQFYQTLRKVQRQSGDAAGVITQVQEAYQTYISRVFQVPALKWSPSLVVSDIKKRKLLAPELLAKLKKNLSELDRANKSKAKADEKDSVQLIELVRTHVDALENLKESGQR